MASFIELCGIAKDYGTASGVVHALRGVDLTIEQGEFVAIVGSSGSGKSTLMHLLGCLDRPSRGSYRIAGFDVSRMTADERAVVRNRLIGFIFQAFNLLPRTSAHDNCEAPLHYRGLSTSERRRRAAAALAAVGLSERSHHFPDQLSGGQQQRVTIARALVSDPPLLLADEPTGNLDSRTSYEILALLQTLNRERGVTVILVTHEPDIAACAKRVITVRDGLIVSDEPNLEPVRASERLTTAPSPGLARPSSRPTRQRSAPVAFGWRDYLVPALWALVGVAVGSAYSLHFTSRLQVWIPVVAAAIFSSWAAARVSGKHGVASLRFDDQARLAFGVTLLWVGALWLTWLGIGVPYTPSSASESLIGRGAASLVRLTLVASVALGGLIAGQHALTSWLQGRQPD